MNVAIRSTPPYPFDQQRQLGFTMVELLVVVAIVGILAAAAAPSFSTLIANRRLNDQTSAFARSINLARSEAIKRGRMVAVCRSDAPEAASPTCGGHTGNWNTGWVIFVDEDDDGAIDTNDTIIRVQQAWENSGTITTNGNAGNRLRFRPSGIGTAMSQTFTFNPARSGTASAKNIALATTGRWIKS